MKVTDDQLKKTLDDYFIDRPLVGKDKVMAIVEERFDKAVQTYIAPHKVEEVEPVDEVFHDTFHAEVRKAKPEIVHDRSTFEQEDDYEDLDATDADKSADRLNGLFGN